MTMKVVRPARTSFPMVTPCRSSPKVRSSHEPSRAGACAPAVAATAAMWFLLLKSGRRGRNSMLVTRPLKGKLLSAQRDHSLLDQRSHLGVRIAEVEHDLRRVLPQQRRGVFQLYRRLAPPDRRAERAHRAGRRMRQLL